MNREYITYIDMDGVVNLFESDPDARKNMHTLGYFINIPVRPGISELLEEINSSSLVILCSKVINRLGVTKEKGIWINNNISAKTYEDVIYVPYHRSKADFIIPTFRSTIVDDNEQSIVECDKKGCSGIFFSETRTGSKYPTARTLDDIWQYYEIQRDL